MLAEVQFSVMSFKASEEQLQQQFVVHIIQITRFVIQFFSDGGGDSKPTSMEQASSSCEVGGVSVEAASSGEAEPSAAIL